MKGSLEINLPNMMGAKSKAVKGLTSGIEGLFKKNKVDYFKAHATLTGKNDVQISPIDGSAKSTINATNIIIATGSVPATLQGLDVDEKSVVTSTGALELTEVPKTLVVVGGGVIGLEMGSVWSRLGTKVTVVEYLDRIIPGTDAEIATNFKRILEKQKIEFKMGTKVNSCKKVGKELVLSVSPAKGGDATELKADIVLVATGRRPNTKDLGLESVGIKMKGLMVDTDSHFRTNVPNIYAIGDVIQGPMLAHKAEEEGIAAVEIIAGKAGHVNYGAIPGVIYTHPEVATVGQSEEDLKKSGQKYKVNKFPFMANSRARTNDDAEGLVKVLVDAETDRLLGVHIIGPVSDTRRKRCSAVRLRRSNPLHPRSCDSSLLFCLLCCVCRTPASLSLRLCSVWSTARLLRILLVPATRTPL